MLNALQARSIVDIRFSENEKMKAILADILKRVEVAVNDSIAPRASLYLSMMGDVDETKLSYLTLRYGFPDQAAAIASIFSQLRALGYKVSEEHKLGRGMGNGMNELLDWYIFITW